MPIADQSCQRQPQLILDDQADHAQGSAAQGEGILAAGRLFVDGEHADQRVEFVSQRDTDADRRGRTEIVGPLGRIVFGDGPGDLRLFAVGLRVVPAHDPLQLRELADHTGDEIRLAEPGGRTHPIHIGVRHGLRNLDRQRRDPVDLVFHGPKARVEDDLAQRRDPALQTLLSVLIPEELGVGQARPQHPLIAAYDVPTAERPLGRRHVRNQQEPRREASIRLHEGKILLVAAHGGREHFVGQCHETVVDAARQHFRPLHQACHLLDQGPVVPNRQPGGVGKLRALLDDGLAALVSVHKDVSPLQTRLVVAVAVDLEGVGRQKGMTARAVGKDQLPIAERQPAVQTATGEDGQHGLQRAYPAEVGFRPAHGLRPAEGADRLGEKARQDFGRCLARDMPYGEEELALGRFAQLRLVRRSKSVGLQKTLDGLLRRAELRPFLLLRPIRLLRRQSLDNQHQTARRDRGKGMIERQPGSAKPVADGLTQSVGGLRLHAGRDFLGAELQQQFRHRLPPLRSPPQGPFVRKTRPRLRSNPWPWHAHDRCRLGARSPRSRRAHPAD